MMVGSISRLFWVIPAAMLIIALAPCPHVYYRVVRLVVFVCAAAISLQSFDRRGWHAWTIALALLAVVFNPILPVHLTRTIWSVLNGLGALLLIAHLWVEREHRWQVRK
jgi:hypothetical protein